MKNPNFQFVTFHMHILYKDNDLTLFLLIARLSAYCTKSVSKSHVIYYFQLNYYNNNNIKKSKTTMSFDGQKNGKVLNSGRQVALNLADLGAILVCVDINEDTAR